MKTWSALRVFFVLAVLLIASHLNAQMYGVPGQVTIPSVPPPLPQMQPPALQDAEIVPSSRSDSIYIPQIPDQPFRVRILIESTSQLADGTTVAQKTRTVAARDAKGRVYRESHELIPANSEREPGMIRSLVFAPQDKSVTTCYPERRTCRHQDYTTAPPVDEPAGPSKDGKYVLTRESLGKKTIQGLETEGTRETRTYAAGVFGNDKPVVVVREHWFSSQLQCDLLLERNDPRNGALKIEMVDVKLGDPGADWFQTPDGYRIFEGTGSTTRPIYPKELAPLLEKDLANLSQDELTNDLKPVEEAIASLSKAHAAGAPNDHSNDYAGQMRSRLAIDFRRLQQMQALVNNFQDDQANVRLNQVYTQVLHSPCLAKPAPGDPPFMISSAEALQSEEQAWLGLRDAWAEFVAKLYPNASRGNVVSWLTNERAMDLRKMENVLRNRGCQPVVTIESSIESLVTGMNPDQLAAALKPVDQALQAYAAVHRSSNPNEQPEFFVQMLQMRLAANLRSLQQSRYFSAGQAHSTIRRLEQSWSAILNSPCLSKSIPGDPPNAPDGPDKFRAEQDAWVHLRDAWIDFLATVFPSAERDVLALQITAERQGELMQVEAILNNRGCQIVPSIAGMLERQVANIPADQLEASLKPVDQALRTYAEAHAQTVPRDQAQFFVSTEQQQLLNNLNQLQHNPPPTREQFEEADLHLNEAWRSVINSPCLEKPVPGDPPNAPTSAEKLRAEEKAWIGLRDAWTAWLAALFPRQDAAVLARDLTLWRTNELNQIRTVLQNRGCGNSQ